MDTAAPPKTTGLLQASHLLGWLRPDRIHAVAAECSVRTCLPGDDLFRRGTPADRWILVQHGSARPFDLPIDAPWMGTASAGHAFGAHGLFVDATWPFTLRAESDVTVLAWPRHVLARFSATLDEAERAELKRRAAIEEDFRFLRTLRVFAQLPTEGIEQILDHSVHRQARRGEYLFREDEPSHACFILRTGRVQLLKQVDASRKQLAVRRSGDFVGEIELLYGTPRMADAIAATDVDLFELPSATFDALIPDGRCREAIFTSATERLLQYQNALAESDRRAIQEQLPSLVAQWITIRSGLWSRAYPFVPAESPMAAGVACLAMLDRFHGRESSWEGSLEQLLAGGAGETLVSLSRKADEFGYRTRLVQVDVHSAAGLVLPAIIEDDNRAPAVLFSLGRRGAIIASPGGAVRHVTRAEIEALWQGQVLTVEHVPRQLFRHLLQANLLLAASIAGASVLLTLFGLAGPLAGKLVVDRVVVTADLTLLRLLGVGLLTILVFRVLVGALREQLLVHATRRAVLFLQVHLLDHVLRLPLGAAQRVGDAARFRHTEHLVDAAVTTGLPLAADTLAVAIGLVTIFLLSPPLALVAALFIVAYGVMGLAFRPSRGARDRPAPRPSAREYLVELVTGIQTVKALASEAQCTARGTRLMLQSRARDLDAARSLRTRHVAGTVLHLTAVAAVLGYGASLTLAGSATAGDLVASLALVSGLIAPVEALLDAGGAARQLRTAVNSVQEVLELPPEESAGRGVAAPVTGHIRLSDVCFRYPGTAEDAVSAVNLEILPGQKVALVGRSGSGKTTLVNLLVGLYQPTRGTIHLDGTDLIAIPKPALRRQLGIVEQQPFLFEGTIADNISRGDPSVTPEQIVRAAQLAGADGFIMALPQGYQTPVGERGARLSGGERQRLTIARALVTNPRLVVLDEATSALDSETEHLIYGSLERSMAGRTVIVIAHRLSTIRHADVIVVLERGRVVEVGSDRELMSRRGLYYYLATRTV